MREIDDPIPREHAACIVRAAEINKLIINTGKCMRAEHLVGIEDAFSTVCGEHGGCDAAFRTRI